MDLKSRLRQQLVSARAMSERLLADFQSPEQWTFQAVPGGNHALWFVGHMAHIDDFFVSLLKSEKAVRKEGWSDKFGTGSQPSANIDDYPPITEVIDYMRDRREALLALLDGLSEADLDKTTPPGTPDFLGDYGMVFQTAAWHEGLHSGQLSVCRRALGHSPVVGGKPKREEQPAEVH